MAQIIAYMAHSALTNSEEQLNTFDAETLQALEDEGITFIAVYDDETREIVKAADITEPEPQVNGVTLCTPVYVDDRYDAIVSTFDAVKPILDELIVTSLPGSSGELSALKSAISNLKTFERTAK